MTLLDINQIKNFLPHRYPFLLVDRVLTLDLAQQSITAIKNVTVNEPFFNGHFPVKPVMPGVLMIEALAQTAGIFIMQSLGDSYSADNIFLLAGVDDTRFKRMVIPGDQLLLQAQVDRAKRNLWRFKTTATVGEELACTAELMIVRTEGE